MGEHAIIVIKNKNSKYLQYFDEGWNSYLFLNCKLPNGNNEEIIKNKVANEFNIEKGVIEVYYVEKKKHKKFSETAKKEKEYIHYFYKVELNTEFYENNFEIDGKKYKFYSYKELLEDKRIMQVNSDIVEFIKEFNL